MKKFFLALVALFFVVVLALVLVDSSYYGEMVAAGVSEVAEGKQMRVAFSESRLNLSGFRASQLEVFFRRALIAINLSKIRVVPVYRKLLRLRPRVELKATLYGGGSEGFFERPLFGHQSGRLGLKLSGLELKQHPFFDSLGIEQGKLDLVLSEWIFEGRKLLQGRALLVLSQISKSEKTIWPGKIFGLPLNPEIPAFHDLSLELQLDIESNRIVVAKFVSGSSLFKLHGSGVVTRGAEGELRAAMIDLDGELLGEGRALLAPWLALWGRVSPDTQINRFRISLRGPLSRPESRLTVLP